MTDDDPGFGVYVHWPFCAAKCPYCDFNSHVRHGRIDQARFKAAYLAELRYMASLQPDQPVRSIFFGGGTPSLMSADLVEALIEAIAHLWPVERGAEITLEANPSSVEAARFDAYRRAGVNRVSLGVQALNDRDLRCLGRLHNAQEARAAIDIARRAFDRVSFDLIYTRPGQDVAQWEDELRQALTFEPDHLSVYQLTIEDGTPFAALHRAGKLAVPPAQAAGELYEATQAILDSAGLPAYEVSNHARAGQECQHNLIYWRSGTYVGVGPGAHGRIGSDGGRTATATERNPELWAGLVESRGHGLTERTALTTGEQADERLIMGLRLREGLGRGAFQQATGLHFDQAQLHEYAAHGLLELSSERIAATPAGRLVLNRLVLEIASSLRDAG